MTALRAPLMTALAAALFLLTPSASAAPLAVPDPSEAVRGDSNAVAAHGDRIYLAGDRLSAYGPQTGPGAGLDPVTGAIQPRWAEIYGGEATSFIAPVVHAAVSDGAGGFFVAGFFGGVGGEDRSNLAHVLADGSVDPQFEVPVDGVVQALARSGTVLFVGGVFTGIGGAPHTNIGAIDTVTGEVVSAFAGSANAGVFALATSADGERLYVGGAFTTVGDGVGGTVARERLAAVSTATGANVANFAPPAIGGAGTAVRSLAILARDGADRLFAGGGFTTPQTGLLALNADSGAQETFNAQLTGGGVLTLAVASGKLYFGGTFTNAGSPPVGEPARRMLAAVDATTAALDLTFEPRLISPTAVTPFVSSIAVDGGGIYVAGLVATDFAVSAFREALVRLDSTTGALDATFNPAVETEITQFTGGPLVKNAVRTVALSSGGAEPTIYVGGDFSSVNSAETDSALVAMDVRSGELIEDFFGGVFEVEDIEVSPDGETIYAGGHFSEVDVASGGEVARNGVAAFDANTGEVLPFDPQLGWVGDPARQAWVEALEVSSDGQTLYIGGEFSQSGGLERHSLTAVSTTDGATLTGFRADASHVEGGVPAPADAVYDLELTPDGQKLYVAGEFDRLSGVDHVGLGRVSAATGALEAAFAPNPSGEVADVAIAADAVYAGGYFSSIGGASRSRLAGLSAIDGTALALDVAPDSGGVSSVDISPDGSRLYAGGFFDNVDGVRVDGIVAIDLGSGAVVLGFAPRALNGNDRGLAALVFDIDVGADGTLVVGGLWRTMATAARANWAFFSEETSNVEAPEINGTPGVGQQLSCDAGRWLGTGNTYAYEWRRNGTPVGSGLQYTVQADDAEQQLTCRVSATGNRGAASAESGPVSVPALPPPPDDPPPADNPPGDPPAAGGTPPPGNLTIQPADRSGPATRLALLRQRLRDVLRRGLGMRVTCDEACAGRVELVLDRRTARRLGLAAQRGAVVIGRGRVSLPGAGNATLRARLTRQAAKRLRRARVLRATVRVLLVDRAGNSTVVSRRVTLRR